MYLVCDGGGTKTEYMLFDDQGMVHGHCLTAGTNAIFISAEAAVESVCTGINACVAEAGCCVDDLEGVWLFIPGFHKQIKDVRMRYPRVQINLLSDEYNAFYGALGRSEGIVVLAGTGSFASGRTGCGKAVMAGGWGPLFDDKGSGYHMGIMCLDKITHQYDMGVEDTPLQRETLKILNVQSVSEIRTVVYRPECTRDKIAKLSYAVAEAAKQNDPDAIGILDYAAECLTSLAATVAQRLGCSRTDVSLVGGVTNMGEMMVGRFQAALKRVLPECRYVPPKYRPIIGSALYVMYEHLGYKQLPFQFIENLKIGMGE